VRTPLRHERKPILCYVTDRQALAPVLASSRRDAVLSGDEAQPAHTLREAIHDAASAGVDWIQIREKDIEGRPLAELVRQAVSDTQGTGTKILVNDRLDIAISAGAAGVHLGEMSLPVEVVAQWRRSAGRMDFQIGASCHSLEAAHGAARAGADYIFFGPIFATPSKAGFGPPQGMERLREVCSLVRIPVLAIGGVSLENASSCIAAGAAGIAAIRLFQEGQKLTTLVARLHAIPSGVIP
jgi:thiamine-phosphate pyrophosphorylase